MDPSRFVAPSIGRVIPVIGTQGNYHAFIPEPITRRMDLSSSTVAVLSRADQALGRLAGAGRHLANPHILVSPYIAREAVSSSRIEGTQASLSDVFDARAEGHPVRGDVLEVQNYIRALEEGLRLLPSLPVSLRLIAQIHGVLMEGLRGTDKTPGEFRRIQSFIGSPDDRPQTATFVPPPPGEHMDRALADWERFAHEDDPEIPLLVRCALLHYQFETIHPFLAGNGRTGRLLIVFFLVERGALPSPLLYLSSYFEDHRRDYIDYLQGVRERGDVEGWISFFLHGVEVQAVDAVNRAERLADLRERYRSRLRGIRSRAGEVVDLLFENPVISAPIVAERLHVTNQGAQHLLRQLQAIDVIRPSTRTGARRPWIAEEIYRVILD